MRKTTKRTAAASIAIATALAGTLTAASPAEASYPTCQANIRTSANHTYLSVTGKPYNDNRVYSFIVQYGVPSHPHRYIPTYRSYTLNRRVRWIHQVDAWVNGYKCRAWEGANIF